MFIKQGFGGGAGAVKKALVSAETGIKRAGQFGDKAKRFNCLTWGVALIGCAVDCTTI
jgi:hypothetical protein